MYKYAMLQPILVLSLLTSAARASPPKNHDLYIPYYGNGTVEAGWPTKSQWLPFQDIFNSGKNLMLSSCKIWHQHQTSADEIASLWVAIKHVSATTGVDDRFIVAVILQESGGCVRVPTSNFGVNNPGIMQDHDGKASCNEGWVLDPCPDILIENMALEGTGGTPQGDGLVQCLEKSGLKPGDASGKEDVSAYYRAARMYNSGSIDASGDLGVTAATRCYASDVANRLTGWALAERECRLDDGRWRR